MRQSEKVNWRQKLASYSDQGPPESGSPNSDAPKPRGGPISPEGKARSAQNALTHGGTSAKLLGLAERQSYESFLQQLRAEYPSHNPLVQMQLERISRLKVQLERVNASIEAQVELARLSMGQFDRISEGLGLDDREQSMLLHWFTARLGGNEVGEVIDQELAAVGLELSGIPSTALLRRHDDFESGAPLFCEYIVRESLARGESLSDFLGSRRIKLATEPDNGVTLVKVQWSGESKFIDTGIEIRNTDRSTELEDHAPQRPNLSALRSVDVELLQQSAEWFRRSTRELLRDAHILEHAREVMDASLKAALPPSPELDRLMRYQTTINRQLSTAIGELLELDKRSR